MPTLPLPSRPQPARSRALARALLAMTVALSLVGSLTPAVARAQEKEKVVVPGPVLAGFSSMRVAVLPVQLWRADTSGWSDSVAWASTRLAVDSAVTVELEARGLGKRWAYASDVVRSAKRNPTYASDPYAVGVSRWRAVVPKPGDPVPPMVADNLRPLTALGDTRYALIPVELRAEGPQAVLRLVLADTRTRRVIWTADVGVPGGEGMVDAIAKRVADLVLEP